MPLYWNKGTSAPARFAKPSVRTVLSGVLAVAAMAVPAMADKTKLEVYSAIIPEDRIVLAEMFNAKHPDIQINWVSDSTGVVTARLLAEKNNPTADIIWGLAVTSMMMLQDEDMLEPYTPKGIETLDQRFVDRSDPPFWVGTDAWVASICVNTIEAEKAGLAMPTSWQDLTKPEYKGHIVMPNPASSGTGYLDVTSWIQIFGEEEAWAYMDKLHENIDHYTHSGSKPCKEAASGEATIGISYMARAARLKSKGAPIELIIPSEGIGWDMEASAIIKGTDKLEAAQTLMDFIISREAMEAYGKKYAVVALPGAATPIADFPDGVPEAMIDNDFAFAARERKRLLAEWSKRYDSKSETE